jgi:hypothetical protein
MGVREHGDCAGHNGDAVSANAGQAPVVADVIVGGHTGNQGRTQVQDLYTELEPNFVFGALDAHDFLVSRKSPVAGLVDRRHVAVMGHSLGAYAAALTGNGDPKHRFAAAVAMDSYARFGHHVGPRVPTMYLQSEQEFFSGPRLAPPPPRALHGTRYDYPRFERRGVPVFYGVLAASTHQEFAYVGPESGATASSLGQRVATYYALAWLDRWLRGQRSATPRLLGPRFDRSIDASSIGLGHWDPAGERNVPYRIAGLQVRDLLSRYYLSESRFDGVDCADLRVPRGCSSAHG